MADDRHDRDAPAHPGPLSSVVDPTVAELDSWLRGDVELTPEQHAWLERYKATSALGLKDLGAKGPSRFIAPAPPQRVIVVQQPAPTPPAKRGNSGRHGVRAATLFAAGILSRYACLEFDPNIRPRPSARELARRVADYAQEIGHADADRLDSEGKSLRDLAQAFLSALD